MLFCVAGEQVTFFGQCGNRGTRDRARAGRGGHVYLIRPEVGGVEGRVLCTVCLKQILALAQLSGSKRNHVFKTTPYEC